MNMYDIKTTLNIKPTVSKTPEICYITRGASATLNFDFQKKIYGFVDTDQITFILKQGKELNWYKLFTYLVPTTDTEASPAKTYYSNVVPIENDTFQCTATVVEDSSVNPAEAGLYEEVEGNHSWRDTYYLLDPHFSQSCGEGWDYVTLILSSEDTLKFKATRGIPSVECEVAVRLNTDTFASLGSQDSIIIEPQRPIAVLDSLYSKMQ